MDIGDVVKANIATFQPVLDKSLQEWLTRLKSTSEASITSARH